MKPQQLRRYAFDRLNDGDVTKRYHDELETELCLRSVMESERTESAVQKVAENTIGYKRKQARNDWFDEECEMVNENKNAARARAIGFKTRFNKNI
jgi:hypothetical protein